MNSHLTSIIKIKIKEKLTLVSIALLFANQIFAQLPDPGSGSDAKPPLLLLDPQNDFPFSPDGATWGVVGEECNEEQYSRKLRSTFKITKEEKYHCFCIPHYYFKHDCELVNLKVH
jgi:hypothetical protein